MIIPIKSKGEIFELIIDDEDYEKICKKNWAIHHLSHTKYCKTHIYIDGKKTSLNLHRFLMGLENGDKRIINHKDGNGLNNKKSNLEICDQKYNTQSINTKNNFGNIFIRKDRPKKYRPRVFINKKKYEKLFYTREEAEEYLKNMEEFARTVTTPL